MNNQTQIQTQTQANEEFKRELTAEEIALVSGADSSARHAPSAAIASLRLG